MTEPKMLSRKELVVELNKKDVSREICQQAAVMLSRDSLQIHELHTRLIGMKFKHRELRLRKENDMSERKIERILAEEADEAKAWEAIEEYLRGVNA